MKNQFNQATEKNKSGRLSKIIFGVVGVLIIGGLAAAGIFYKVEIPFLKTKTQIILEPDYSLVATVNPADLENANQILNARCRAIECGISFAVGENNQIIAEAPIYLRNARAITEKIAAIGLVEIVNFGETSIEPGTKIATDLNYKHFVIVEGKKWHTVITNNEFETATATQNKSGEYQISFTLTPAGKKLFFDYTTNNLGRYLGIVMDKVVIWSPKVSSSITTGRGIIAGSFTKEEAEYLAAYLSTQGPLPIPLKLK